MGGFFGELAEWAALGTADDLTQYPGQQHQGTSLGPSTFQHRGQRSGPSAASTAEMPGQAGLDSWAAGQIASLSPVSYRDSLIKQT